MNAQGMPFAGQCEHTNWKGTSSTAQGWITAARSGFTYKAGSWAGTARELPDLVDPPIYKFLELNDTT